MAKKAFNIAKDIFNLAKGKALEKDRKGSESLGKDTPEGAFNIGTFIGRMQETNGLARANKFLVEIDPPTGGWVNAPDVVQHLSFLSLIHI